MEKLAFPGTGSFPACAILCDDGLSDLRCFLTFFFFKNSDSNIIKELLQSALFGSRTITGATAMLRLQSSKDKIACRRMSRYGSIYHRGLVLNFFFLNLGTVGVACKEVVFSASSHKAVKRYISDINE
jgi:hypothetical protein